jgi:predicted outer membrane repeat protein
MNAHRIIRSSVLFVFTVVLAVALPWLLTGHGPVARAATLQVCPAACPYTTIQAAVTAASSGDTINIGEGTYPEHVVVGSKVLTFVGAGASSTFVDGTNNGRVFSVTAASATFADLTIQNGKVISDSGGGIYANGALTLTDVAVLNNRSESRLVGGNVDGGGGVRVLGALSVTGGRFENNAVPTPLGEGGAIRSNAAAAPHPSVTISGTVFISNTAKYGGAVSAGGTTRITNTQVFNTATLRRRRASAHSPSVTLSGARLSTTRRTGEAGRISLAQI